MNYIKKFFGIDTNKLIYKVREKYNLINDKQIKNIIICRKPINNLIKEFINVVSLGELNKNMEKYNYDKLFHLSILLIYDYNNICCLVEKNEYINIDFINKDDYLNKCEYINVDINNKILTLEKLFNNTIEKIGKDNFYIYRFDSWNCQNFIYNILYHNNLMNEFHEKFILQDTFKILENLNYLKQTFYNITDIGRIIKGNGTNKNYVLQSILFNKKYYNIDESINFLIENKFKYNNVDEDKNYYRFRQYNPYYIKNKGYINYVSKKINNDKIILILAYKQ
jgi:hypothetical protein